MTGNLYTVALDNSAADSFSLDLQVSRHSFAVTFAWPSFTQELYDDANRAIEEDMAADPLTGNSKIVREYDYLDYYLNQVPSINVREWMREQELLPVTVRNVPESAGATMLTQRKVTCTGIKQYLEQLEETLHWQVTINEGGEITVVDVIPGAWFRNQDSSWSVRFTTDSLSAISRDQLSITTMEFAIHDDD